MRADESTHLVKVLLDDVLWTGTLDLVWLEDHALVQQTGLEPDVDDLAIELFDLGVVLLSEGPETGLNRAREALDGRLRRCPYVLVSAGC